MSAKPDITLTTPGEFVVGCNFWASHSGTAMWSDWRPDVVAEDLKLLSAEGLELLRVFPLWPDFQPITLLRKGGGAPEEYRFGEEPLPDTEAGRAGIRQEALDHFKAFADMAGDNGLKLMVGLVTGWMSGRLFVPPALEGRNVLADPVAVMWQVRFVKHFVRTFRDHPAIVAWDLGNECNCLGSVTTSEQAWQWTAAIANTIRSEDNERPIVSGMHSIAPNPEAIWKIQDQAELTDVLTTHPYPIFTPHCDMDPINTMRPCLHATAESRYYADIGATACLAEEVGTIGPMIANENIAADYIRTILFSLWAHDCHGMLWWCGFDQDQLTHAPYDWCPVERQLGLLRTDRTPKPVVKEIGRFASLLKGFPIDKLPPRKCEAVCILTAGQDQWASAYASFVLAKQAGFDIEFQYCDQPLKDADLYLMPSVSGYHSFYNRLWNAVEEKVRGGATLYLSHKDCLLSPFEEFFGARVHTRERVDGDVEIAMDGLPGKTTLKTRATMRLRLESIDAQVLGREPDGNPVFTRTQHGKGAMYFLGVPLEDNLSNMPGVFHKADAHPFHQIYRTIAGPHMKDRIVTRDSPLLALTEHELDDSRRAVIAINHDTKALTAKLTLADGWAITNSWHGPPPDANTQCKINPNDAIVFVVEKA